MTIDYDAISRKYDEERLKRLRKDGNDQFIEIRSGAAGFDRDPHADPDFTRDPVSEEVDVLIIGAGIAGMLAAGRLREAGVRSLRIIEKGADFGGTWYWNRYPGLYCDVESYIYLPMVEELGVMPTTKYASGAEIRSHCEKLARHFDLYPAALLQTGATGARWDENRARWIVTTSRGDEIAARFLVTCTGFLSNPKLPRIPGIDSFEGRSFHTSRWDFTYTGGDERGGMTGLADKRVGIIGTGSTGVQAVPPLQQSAKHLYVFQRTPSGVDVRGNAPTDVEWFRSLKPGWTRQRRDNFSHYLSGGQVEEDLIGDGWTDILPRVDPDAEPDPMAFVKAGIEKMERIRQRIDAQVRDRATAEALKPWYHFFCKRPTFHDEFLQTFNEPNVTLVDTDGQGVERITPKGVVVAGREYELDCLIFATGFDFNADLFKESGIDFEGRGGLRLSDYWAEGPRTLHGLHAHGFPNLLFPRLAQAGFSANYTHTVDEQAKYVAFLISAALERGVATFEPSCEAEAAWVDMIVEQAGPKLAFLQACTPGHYNGEGNVGAKLARGEFYAAGPMAYYAVLAEWRAEGTLRGLDLTYRRS